MARRYNRDKWVNAWEIERLGQLLYDLELLKGRYLSECVKAGENYPLQRAEWEAAAAAAETALGEMERRCEALLERYSREHRELEG